MKPEPERLKAVFAEALAQPEPATRATYLDAACRGDPELRASVEALLLAHDQAGDFLEPKADALNPPPSLEAPGTVIGRYKLLHFKLGRWWDAEREQRAVLELERAAHGPEHPGTLISINNLAATLDSLGRPEEALTMLSQSQPIRCRVLVVGIPDIAEDDYFEAEQG